MSLRFSFKLRPCSLAPRGILKYQGKTWKPARKNHHQSMNPSFVFGSQNFNLNPHVYFKTRKYSLSAIESSNEVEKEASAPQKHNSLMYNELLKITRDSNLEDEEFLTEAMSLFGQISHISLKGENKHNVSETGTESRDGESAPLKKLISLAKRTENNQLLLKVYGYLMHLYALRGKFVITQTLFDSMLRDAIEADYQSYLTLMESYFIGGEFEKTLEIFEQIKWDASSLGLQAYTIAIKAYMKLNRFQDAIDVFGLMKEGTAPDISLYNIVMTACIEVRETEKAWTVYDMLRRSGCQPNSETFSLIIYVAQKKDLRKALDLFEEMLAKDIPPEGKCVKSLLAALSSKPVYYATSINLLNGAIEQGFQPDAFTFSILLRSAQKNKNLTDARRFFVGFISQKASLEDKQMAFSTLFYTYAQAFKRDDEQHLVVQEISSVNDLDFLNSPTPTSFEEAVKEAIKVHTYFEQHVQQKMPSTLLGFIRESFLTIFTHYNYFDQAMKYYQKHFNDTNTAPIVYSSILGMCRRIKKGIVYYKMLNQINFVLAPITPHSNLTPGERTKYKYKKRLSPGPLLNLYQEIIIGLTRFGDLDLALNYFENQCLDPDQKISNPANFYSIFVNAIKTSKNPRHKERLDLLIKTHNPVFLC